MHGGDWPGKTHRKRRHPSHTHLALLAWNLLIPNGPQTIWQPLTVLRVYPIRWQVEEFLSPGRALPCSHAQDDHRRHHFM